jgi:hypothetical protein
MKQLVKYQPPGKLLAVRFGKVSYMRTAAQVIAIGAGDCTVQEDGHTVWVGRAHMEKLVPTTPVFDAAFRRPKTR